MSTRATYRFEHPNAAPITYYIHHDGFLEGAARYLLAACLHTNARGHLPEQFLRANDRAEFTCDHRAHSDTQYHYTIDANHQLLAEQRVSFTTTWRTAYFGPLIDFIRAYAGIQLVRFNNRYLNKNGAGLLALHQLGLASHAFDKGWTGNAGSHTNDTWNLYRLYVQAFGADAISERIRASIEAADQILCKTWESTYGANAYEEWRRAFRTQALTEPSAQPTNLIANHQ